jgi:hypothetical protein
MCVALDAARKHLSELWASSARKFQFLATPVRVPKAAPVPEAEPKPPPKLTETQAFESLIGMPQSAPAQSAKTAADGGGGSSSSSAAGSSAAGSSAAGSSAAGSSAAGSSAAGSSAGSGSGVLDSLRAGWIPFGSRPIEKKKPAKEPAARKRPQTTLVKPEAAAMDFLSPAAVELPGRLGRSDVHARRVHKVRRMTMPIVAGEGGIGNELALKMQRSQSFGNPDNRPAILEECVRAYRAAAR